MRRFKIAIRIKKRYQGRQRDSHQDLINERIPYGFKRILVIGSDGKKIGILSRQEALNKSVQEELDLVIISKNGEVPVAKIIDYGKFRYERKKREQENKRNSKTIDQKEIRISANIGMNDLLVKVKSARKFIEKGNNIKISLAFKGRQIVSKDIGFAKMNQFIEDLADIAQVDKKPQLYGRFYDAYLSPIKKK
ncbi:/ infC / Translation initiation factor IF-3 /:381488 Forward [Candidatus Hepatoplasma crinochetorum]|uniref:Translation initiation factor IF-3 n=1 Tax=Candidatus Hepatoplasma crinochetorum TaxID=295596 RepID=A0A0G7ZL28_9MOLU|nr:/ infC / Translation initiation factor IF-3 /:381488 Forward [Candidatus Hepatoplasma crinochetorum]